MFDLIELISKESSATVGGPLLHNKLLFALLFMRKTILHTDNILSWKLTSG